MTYNNTPLKAFVINLDDYKENFEKQKPYLENLGLEVHRFKAINGNKDEHLQYKSYIHPVALEFTPKSVIGCGLSHLLLVKYITENFNDDYYLIMEDDAHPLEKYNNTKAFYAKINTTISEVSNIDPNWDIINLHTDLKCTTTNNINILSGSAAAYLISKNITKKLLQYKIYHTPDILTNFTTNKYKSTENLFYTDERSSTNRIFNNNIYLLDLKLLLISLFMNIECGEKSHIYFLTFKLFKINNTNYTLNNLLDFIFITLFIIIIILSILILYFFKYNSKKIITKTKI
jgi:hypothetical protein